MPDRSCRSSIILVSESSRETEGRKSDALVLMRQRVQVLRDLLGERDLIVAEALRSTAALSYELKDYRAARADLRELLPIEKKHRPPTDPVLDDLRLKLAEAERISRPEADQSQRLPRLADLVRKTKRFADEGRFDLVAEALSEQQAVLIELLGPADPVVIEALRSLAELYQIRLDNREAEKRTLTHAVDGAVRCYGASDWRVTDLRRKLARAERAIQKNPADERMARATKPLEQEAKERLLANDIKGAVEIIRRLSSLYQGKDEEEYVKYLEMEAILQVTLGNTPLASTLLVKLLELKKLLFRGTEHPDYAKTLHQLGIVSLMLKQTDPGMAFLREAYSIRKRNKPQDNTLSDSQELIVTLVRRGTAEKNHEKDREEGLALFHEITRREPLHALRGP